MAFFQDLFGAGVALVVMAAIAQTTFAQILVSSGTLYNPTATVSPVGPPTDYVWSMPLAGLDDVVSSWGANVTNQPNADAAPDEVGATGSIKVLVTVDVESATDELESDDSLARAEARKTTGMAGSGVRV
jgi:hypothetical protein